MIGRQPPPETEEREDDVLEKPPTPVWRRRGVLLLVGVTAVFLLFIFTRTGTVTKPVVVGQDDSIAVHQPYEGAKDAPLVRAAAPATVLQPPPQPPAPPPEVTKMLSTGGPALNGKHSTVPTAMVSYPVHIEPLPPPKETKVPEPDRTGLKFNTATLPGLKASPAIDETYMLMPGLLPLVLDTAIDSNLPGPIFAHLPGPVYSPKGVLLMEAGTQVTGRYESMKQNGVNRLEAITAVAHTPNGIWVSLAGQQLGDDLGRAGLSATIDHRYFERFGGAVLLDLSQAGLGIVQANVAKGGNTYLNFNGSDQLANQILQSTIALPPIGTKNQGSTIAILLTEPISFADSYRVVAK